MNVYALIFQFATFGVDAHVVGQFETPEACQAAVAQRTEWYQHNAGRNARGGCMTLEQAQYELRANACKATRETPAVGPLPAELHAWCPR